MSEVIDQASYRNIGRAHVVAHPGPEFSQALEHFIHPSVIRQLGGRALKLRSEASLTVVEGAPQDRVNVRRKTVSKAELSKLSQDLLRRQHSAPPRVGPDVSISPFPQHPDMADAERGIDLRFKLLLDRLTRQVLHDTVLLNQDDDALYVHFRLVRSHMVLGEALRTAHRSLVDLVKQQKPGMIESMHLTTPDIHV